MTSDTRVYLVAASGVLSKYMFNRDPTQDLIELEEIPTRSIAYDCLYGEVFILYVPITETVARFTHSSKKIEYYKTPLELKQLRLDNWRRLVFAVSFLGDAIWQFNYEMKDARVIVNTEDAVSMIVDKEHLWVTEYNK